MIFGGDEKYIRLGKKVDSLLTNTPIDTPIEVKYTFPKPKDDIIYSMLVKKDSEGELYFKVGNNEDDEFERTTVQSLDRFISIEQVENKHPNRQRGGKKSRKNKQRIKQKKECARSNRHSCFIGLCFADCIL